MKNIQLKITIILIIVSSILLSGVSLINLYNFNKIVSQNNYSEITQIIGSSKTVLEIKTTSKINNNVDDYEVFLDQLLFYIQYMKSKKGLLDVFIIDQLI